MDTIDKINYYLTKNKKTGADLCEFLGVSSGVYSQWNTRRTKPRKSKLPAVAEYLGVSVADLLPDDDPSAGIKKDPIPKDEAVSSAAQEIFDFLDSASGEELADVIKYIRYLKSQRGQA
jgi:transcriptional regulator with XRE-family HTH domain|nr:MAG TPA: helix-turn-helix domain protein [Caudoviricetes sp.]